MSTILNKRAMLALYHKGAFGNRLRMWKSPEEFLQSGYVGFVTLRYAGLGGSRCDYRVPAPQVPKRINEWVCQGACRQLISIWEGAPDEKWCTMNGEVIRSARGWELLYSREKLPMRYALKKSSLCVYGLTALAVLKTTLDPSSYDDLMELFDLYPDCAVEFTAFLYRLVFATAIRLYGKSAITNGLVMLLFTAAYANVF